MKFIDWFADGSVYVVDLALACCGVESGAAVLANAPVREEIRRRPDSGARFRDGDNWSGARGV